MHLALVLLAMVPPLAATDCECGYSATSPDGSDEPWVFTDQLESDFAKAQDISEDTDWRRQQFNVSAENGHGEYGKAFMPDNVMAGPDAAARDGLDSEGGGLELQVGSTLLDGSVPVAEIDTTRLDLHWGSYRAGLKVTDVSGTCASFFWYFNDTQEIDIEFLSRQFDRDKHVFPVNLVIQTKRSMQAGFDASGTDTYKTVDLSFDPTAGFHEYRFDYVPGRVLFYADSKLLAEMDGADIPSSPGHLILQHWSNGNPLWSGGPPADDALLTVSYVKAYFNSSDQGRQSELAKRCASAKDGDVAGSVCVIPDVTAANASSGGSFFAQDGGSHDSDDGEKTETPGSGDDEDDKDSGAAQLKPGVSTTWATTSFIAALLLAQVLV